MSWERTWARVSDTSATHAASASADWARKRAGRFIGEPQYIDPSSRRPTPAEATKKLTAEIERRAGRSEPSPLRGGWRVRPKACLRAGVPGGGRQGVQRMDPHP